MSALEFVRVVFGAIQAAMWVVFIAIILSLVIEAAVGDDDDAAR